MQIINVIVTVVLATFVPLTLFLLILWLSLKWAHEESGRLIKVIKWLSIIILLVVVIWGIGTIIARV